MPYLITISLILHLITFFIIIILFQKCNLKNSLSQTNEQEKLKREIEDLLVAYTIEMKEENEKLVNNIMLKRKAKGPEQINTVTSYENQKSKTQETNKASLPPKYKQPVQKTSEEEDFILPISEDTKDTLEQSTTAQVLSLANQGFSAKEIAKRLSMGDGEVELLLKFHK